MDDVDHVRILATVKELPFPVGKHTLSEILIGAVTKKMVVSNVYTELEGYGCLEGVPQAKVEQAIDRLQSAGLLAAVHPPGQIHMRVLKLTAKGIQELKNPTAKKEYTSNFKADDQDEASKLLIANFSFFLSKYNPEQQHAIVSPAKRILCVAGAGTGKTTVLTKRIEFLVKYRSVDPRKILAITFTRKARAEMQHRLADIGAEVTTFNGFCDRLLKSNNLVKPMLTYGQKIRLLRDALLLERLEIGELLHNYFTDQQRKGANRDELERRFMGDVYSLIDHYANEDQQIPVKGKSPLATTLLNIARRIQQDMAHKGIRDYSGQLTEALALLRTKPSSIPKYEHILVDEYQDVNVAQQRLLEILNPDHLFVVGDPRQSIFGWRGSQIRFITDFPADTTIQLRTNYRSQQTIVVLMNKLIAGMHLPDLITSQEDPGVVQTLKYNSEDEELGAIATLLKHATQKNIFVLARTNRQLQDLSQILVQRDVKHSVKHEEDESEPEGLLLATVHAIKGLEAETVIVLGTTSRYFPCKVSDHPVVDLIKDSDLDREEEEKRLLYVAVSRAKERLIITYTSSPTYFLDGVLGDKPIDTKLKVEKTKPQKQRGYSPNSGTVYDRLRQWRSDIARKRGLPSFFIATDRTLKELSEVQPRTLAEMHDVYGLGDEKIKQFGDELLDVIHKN